ncbi:MAG: hypothetical protein EHM35_13115 [Planctomycetaceae bacterium]|nr:MAG: hypothetical protein EHM35_13115 [Planctomycetaceae bacterium]
MTVSPHVYYRADYESGEVPGSMIRDIWPGADAKWRPSIHMPRWASRTTLEVTEVRVQRVQEITCKDAEAEGAYTLDGFGREVAAHVAAAENLSVITPVILFRVLWNSINAKRGYGWDKNPWVWAVTFRRIPQA